MSSIHNSKNEYYLNHTEKFAERDTFGRFRVSNPVTLFDFSNIDDINHQIYFDEKTENGGTITHSNNSYEQLDVTTTSGSRVVCQSKQYIHYQPGKSKIAFISGVLETQGGTAGIRSRIGMFDDENDKNTVLYDAGGNGLFFELDGTTLHVVERTSNNGTGQTDVAIPQNEWNIDTFGAGALNPSKRIFNDFSKTCLFVIDLEWLGVGFSRFGMVFDGKIYYCHIFKHKKIQKPYIRYAKLPIRFELETTGTPDRAGSSRQICGTVLSEGGYNMKAKEYADGTNSNYFVVPYTHYAPLLTLRLKPNYNRNLIYLKKIDFLVESNKPIHYDVRLNPSEITGVTFNSVSDLSIAEISVTGLGVTGGLTLNSGYVDSKGSSTLATTLDDILNQLPISSNITGESDLLTIAAVAVGGAVSNTYCQMNWLELN